MGNYYVFEKTTKEFNNKMQLIDLKAHIVVSHKINDDFIIVLDNQLKAMAIMYLLNYFKFGHRYKIDKTFTEEFYKEVINDYPELFAV